MNGLQPHIILSTTLLLETEGNTIYENPQVHLDRLSDMANHTLPVLLDTGFSKVIPENEIWKVDRLELEIDIDDLAKMEESIKSQLPHLIKNAVKDTSHKAIQPKIGRASKVIPGRASMVLHYLKSGTLPWNSPSETSMADMYRLFDAISNTDTEFVRDLCWLFASNNKALKRFLIHFQKRHHQQFYQSVRMVFPRKGEPVFLEWNTRSKQGSTKGSIPSENQWREMLKKALSGDPIKKESVSDSFSSEEIAEAIHQHHPTDQNPIYLTHAGLIFLHPFLARFLENLGLVQEKEILDADQAVSVLHSLVTGTSPTEELHLILPKILLGLAVDTPVTLRQVSALQRNTGKEMIQSAIAHWDVLGSTSINSFRESFLQRSGKLTPYAETWLLELESAPFDMLIDQLPWQMSYIKLPWMKICVRMNI